VREAEAAAVAATVAREEAASTVRRMESLRAVGGVSDQALEQARTALAARQGEQDGARLRVQAAQYEARSARAAAAPAGGTRGALRIASPIPGRVLRVHAEFERVVPAGTPWRRRSPRVTCRRRPWCRWERSCAMAMDGRCTCSMATGCDAAP
jgi:multidrug resistance efflux pump